MNKEKQKGWKGKIMKVTEDSLAGALYIKLKNGKIYETIEVADEVFVDLDKGKEVLGIEVLGRKGGLSRCIERRE